MALFVVRHQHAAERCPAQDPYMGAMLLNHLSRPYVRQHGVEIRCEAVVQRATEDAIQEGTFTIAFCGTCSSR